MCTMCKKYKHNRVCALPLKCSQSNWEIITQTIQQFLMMGTITQVDLESKRSSRKSTGLDLRLYRKPQKKKIETFFLPSPNFCLNSQESEKVETFTVILTARVVKGRLILFRSTQVRSIYTTTSPLGSWFPILQLWGLCHRSQRGSCLHRMRHKWHRQASFMPGYQWTMVLFKGEHKGQWEGQVRKCHVATVVGCSLALTSSSQASTL